MFHAGTSKLMPLRLRNLRNIAERWRLLCHLSKWIVLARMLSFHVHGHIPSSIGLLPTIGAIIKTPQYLLVTAVTAYICKERGEVENSNLTYPCFLLQ